MSTPVTLESLGLRTFQELYELPVAEVVARLDKVPLHAGDAFLVVLALRSLAEVGETTEAVGRAVEELHRTTAAIDLASRRLEWAALIIGVIAVVVGVAGVVATISA